MKKAISLLSLIICVGIGIVGAQTANDKGLKKKEKKNQRIEKLKKKHEEWDSCFIVKAKGDTIYGKVDHRENQSSVLDGYVSSNIIFFAQAETEKEEQFIPNDIRELYIYNGKEEHRKYITIADKYYVSDYGMLYRIIVDGACKLIAIRVVSQPVNQRQPEVRPVLPKDAILNDFGATEEHYFIYYKKRRTQIKVDVDRIDPLIVINNDVLLSSFRENYKEVFKECAVLVEKIENKTYGPDDLRQIVKEFNQYIANNPAAQTKK